MCEPKGQSRLGALTESDGSRRGSNVQKNIWRTVNEKNKRVDETKERMRRSTGLCEQGAD